MDLTALRAQIDRIDSELVRLFSERMQTAEKIAEYKSKNGLPIGDPAREEEKLEAVSAAVPAEYARSVKQLYSRIFELSRDRQQAVSDAEG